MDKVIGRALLDGARPALRSDPLSSAAGSPSSSSRRPAVAGCPVLVGVGAPTSLAIELATDRGMTLAGFARSGSVNVYSGTERVV